MEGKDPLQKKAKTGYTILEDDGEIGGSRVHFPLHLGETPTQSTEEQREQPTAPQRT